MTTTAAPQKSPKKSAKEVPVVIDNVGGIRHAELVLKPGVNVLVGANGAGKTSAMQAIRRAFGEKVPVEKMDGTLEGRITVPGLVVKIGKIVKATGEAEMWVCDAGPVTRIIDPGIKGSEEAATARVRALVELLQPAFDAASLETLAGDAQIAAEVLSEYGENAFDNLADAAERTRLIAHRHARAAEAVAKSAAAVASAAEQAAADALERAGGEDALVEIPVADAERAAEEATGALAVAKEARRRRLALELQQNEIRETVGEKPDPTRFDTDLQIRRDAMAASEERIRELERKIAQERETMAGIRADGLQLAQRKTAEEDRLRTWERQSAVLAQVPEGPEEFEVERLELEAQRAAETRRAATVSAQVRTQLDQAKREKERCAAAAEYAERLRGIATTVFDRMAELPGLAERAGRFAISVGRLYVKDEHGNLHDFETRQSSGQKVRAVLEVAASVYGDNAVIGLEDRYWSDLDEERRAEFGAIAAANGLSVITCSATSGALGIEHVGANAQEVTA